MKTAKIGAIFLMSLMALAGIGAGYAAWTDTIYIAGTVNTGSVGWDVIEYSGTWVYKNLDTDACIIQDHEEDPLPTNWLLVAYSYAKQAMSQDQTPVTVDDAVTVVYNNIFPCINFDADITIEYTGSVPGKLNSINIVDPWASDVNEPTYGDEVKIDQYTTLDVTVKDAAGNPVAIPQGYLGLQLHDGYTIHIVMTIHLPQDNTLMNLHGDFGVYLEIIQWNEYDIDS